MTRFEWQFIVESVHESRLLAEVLALKLRAGDVVALSGDLGAGKTTFARALIRAVAGEVNLEVPSPTFALMQAYDTPRFSVRHFDAYRLAGADEFVELGFHDDVDDTVSVVEWPERVAGALPDEQIVIKLDEMEDGGDDVRRMIVHCDGAPGARLQRVQEIWSFVQAWANGEGIAARDLAITYMQGDASARAYARVETQSGRHILMDSPRQPDGPAIRNGLAYSRLAHLAEDIQPFIVIGEELGRLGLTVPATRSVDRDRGLALIEDLGDRVFGREIEAGRDLEPLYAAAITVLHRLRANPPPAHLAAHGCVHVLPRMDRDLLAVEIELLLDWFAPAVAGRTLGPAVRESFFSAWSSLFDHLQYLDGGWVLRDFHSPNLILRDGQAGAAAIGVIDYQDALVGHPAYDLVSLLQDARLDVPADVEARLFARYIAAAQSADAHFDAGHFTWAYALLGAQRNTKILGIFARLSMRDGKPQYLGHIPRISRYLSRNLKAAHMRPVRDWFAEHLPEALTGERAGNGG